MIPASFVSYTLTQPVARVAEIADAKEKAAKDRAVRVLTDERMYPLEDLQKCEEHFQKVSAYVEARREIISHAKGARIFPDAIPEDVWKSLDILCRAAPAMYLEARLKVTIGVIADAYKRKGMVRPSVHDHRLVPDASWVKTDSDVRKYIKQLRALPDGSRKRFPAVIREHIARASMKLPIPVVADRFGISTGYVGEVRREFKEKQEEKSEF